MTVKVTSTLESVAVDSDNFDFYLRTLIADVLTTLVRSSGNSVLLGSEDDHVKVEFGGALKFVGDAGFHPPRVRQATIPAPAADSMVIWSDSDDDSVYLVYNDADAGVVSVPSLNNSQVGTVGRVPYWSAPGVLSAGSMRDNGSRAGIGGEPDATAMLKVTGALYVDGDVYSNKWASHSSTVSGWAAGATTDIRYKKIGNLVFVNYKITGTGNTDETNFTLPFQAASTMALATKVGAAGSADDGESDKHPNAGILFPASATTAVVRLDTLWNNDTTGSVYGNGQGKWLCGQFWYEAA